LTGGVAAHHQLRTDAQIVLSQFIGYEASMKRNVLVFAAIFAALAMVLTLVWPGPEPRPEPAEASAAPSDPTAPTPPEASGNTAPRPPAPVLSAATPSAEEDKGPDPADAPAPTGFKDMIESDQGPVAEYARRYDSETRDSDAQAFETQIRTAFMQGESNELLHSVSCRETICRLLMHWSVQRTRAYVDAMRRLNLGGERKPDSIGFDIPLALSPIGPKDSAGVRTVEVYMQRRR
jgi:hypothetical protein